MGPFANTGHSSYTFGGLVQCPLTSLAASLCPQACAPVLAVRRPGLQHPGPVTRCHKWLPEWPAQDLGHPAEGEQEREAATGCCLQTSQCNSTRAVSTCSGAVQAALQCHLSWNITAVPCVQEEHLINTQHCWILPCWPPPVLPAPGGPCAGHRTCPVQPRCLARFLGPSLHGVVYHV